MGVIGGVRNGCTFRCEIQTRESAVSNHHQHHKRGACVFAWWLWWGVLAEAPSFRPVVFLLIARKLSFTTLKRDALRKLKKKGRSSKGYVNRDAHQRT